MNGLLKKTVECPYCGEGIDVMIDCSVYQQSYIEDCQLCCRPINFTVTVHADDDVTVTVTHESE